MMRAVIVGAGASGVLHALALRAARVPIEAVFDPDTARAEALVAVCGGRVVPSLADAASADASLAAICSPPSVHVEQATALASAGRTIFVEKPVATTPDELARLAEQTSCVPIVQWRAGKALRAIRRAIGHGEFGETPSIACDLAWGRDDAYFAARASWGCGALLSIGIHAIDAMSWALGRPIEAVSGMATARDGGPYETTCVALLRFAGGALASLRISLDGGADRTKLTICGRGVSVHLDGPEADPTARPLVWSTTDEATRIRLEALERSTKGASGPPLLVPYLGEAIDALRDGIAPGTSERLPSIAEASAAHAAAMLIAREAERAEVAGRRREVR